MKQRNGNHPPSDDAWDYIDYGLELARHDPALEPISGDHEGPAHYLLVGRGWHYVRGRGYRRGKTTPILTLQAALATDLRQRQALLAVSTAPSEAVQ